MTFINNSAYRNNQIREKLSYPFRYYTGKRNEDKAKTVIKKAFVNANDIRPSKHRYTHYDFYSKKMNCVIEVKTYSKFTASLLIGTNKIISKNIIFILYFSDEPDQFYFLKYEKELFDTFEKMQVRPSGRDYFNECFIIPNNLITKIEKERTYIFNFQTVEDINELIKDDFNKAHNFNEI